MKRVASRACVDRFLAAVFPGFDALARAAFDEAHVLTTATNQIDGLRRERDALREALELVASDAKFMWRFHCGGFGTCCTSREGGRTMSISTPELSTPELQTLSALHGLGATVRTVAIRTLVSGATARKRLQALRDKALVRTSMSGGSVLWTPTSMGEDVLAKGKGHET